MNEEQPLLPKLGFLRASLLLLALINLLPPLVELLLADPRSADIEGAWQVISRVVAPVLAPLLVVGLLFDYIMSRVRAADAEGDEHRRFARIAKLELAAIILNMLVWVPYFATRLG